MDRSSWGDEAVACSTEKRVCNLYVVLYSWINGQPVESVLYSWINGQGVLYSWISGQPVENVLYSWINEQPVESVLYSWISGLLVESVLYSRINWQLVKSVLRLQALVYDIRPSTTAVFSYAIGSRKLSVNKQFFYWCSNSSKFVTNNSIKTRRVIYSHQQSLHQHK